MYSVLISLEIFFFFYQFFILRMWSYSCITKFCNPFWDCKTFANQYVKLQSPTGSDNSSSSRRWYKHSKQTEILLFIDNNTVFLFATQKRVKLPASINKQRERGIDGKKKNCEREKCEAINMRLMVTERRKGMCVNVKRAGRVLSFLSHRFLVVLHCCVNFLLSFSICLSFFTYYIGQFFCCCFICLPGSLCPFSFSFSISHSHLLFVFSAVSFYGLHSLSLLC